MDLYSQLPSYPETIITFHKATMTPVRACKKGDIALAYWSATQSSCYVGKRISVKSFNQKFIIPTAQQIINHAANFSIPAFEEKQECRKCKQSKFIVEFFKIPKKNIHSETCKSCMGILGHGIEKSKKNKESQDRSSRNGFIRYMTNNPVYFKMQFKHEATQENIKTAYSEVMQ